MTAVADTAPSGQTGDTASETATMTLAAGINRGLRQAMADDEKVLILGEDVAELGGVFRITDGLVDEYGKQRVMNTPLAESGIIGTAVGLSARGFRPVVEMQFDAFSYTAYDQIVNQVAKQHYRTGGHLRIPMVIRIPFGGGIGSPEHHSESPEAAFAQHAGLRVMAPSDAHSAYWGIQEAIKRDDPVIFLEPKRRYWMKGEVNLDPATAPPGDRSVIARPGTDVTLVTYGPLVPTALEAALAAAEEGTSVEVVDLRSISPLDLGPVVDSVQRTGRVVVAHEAPVFLGLGGELAARIQEQAFYHLHAPVLRVGAPHGPYPPARLEHHYIPDADRMLDGIDRVLDY
ncbi:MAG: alpha-ketoacid dehydrogenase subunit beta [Micrococcaceae bacterium]